MNKKLKIFLILTTIIGVFTGGYFVTIELNKPLPYNDYTSEFVHKSPEQTIQLLEKKSKEYTILVFQHVLGAKNFFQF